MTGRATITATRFTVPLVAITAARHCIASAEPPRMPYLELPLHTNHIGRQSRKETGKMLSCKIYAVLYRPAIRVRNSQEIE